MKKVKIKFGALFMPFNEKNIQIELSDYLKKIIKINAGLTLINGGLYTINEKNNARGGKSEKYLHFIQLSRCFFRA